MKPLASTIKNSGNLGGVSKAMSISVENMAHLQSVLSNLYSNPTLAVLREYSTNAFDAHVEAGVKRPIKVSLPTSLNPTLMIEDFGIGMTTDQLLNMYSSYGASTKRGTNAQTGMLGLGSKSGLAITDQFTVRTRKGGVETTALIFTNDEGAGEIKIIDTRASDATGTLIQMGVKPDNIRGFSAAARDLFRYWPEGSVEGINDVVSVFADPKVKWIAPNIAILPDRGRYYAGTITVIQGNVPYVVDVTQLSEAARKIDLSTRKHDLVFIADIGTLQFTPSREELYYTNYTNDALEALFIQYQPAMKSHIESLLTKAKTKAEALEVAESWSEYNVGALSWKGQQIPTTIPVECISAVAKKHTTVTRFSVLPSKSNLTEFDYIVVNTDSTDDYVLRQRIARQAGMGGLADKYTGQTKRALFIKGSVPTNWDWIGLPVLEWKSFGVAPKVKGASGPSQAGQEYRDRQWKDCFAWNTYHTIEDEGDGYIYLNGDERERYTNEGPYTYVMVPKNMSKNFAAAFPKAKTRDQAWTDAKNEKESLITDAMRKNQNIMGNLIDTLTRCKTSDILDPTLRAVVELTVQAKKDQGIYNTKAGRLGHLGGSPITMIDWPELKTVNATYGEIITARGYGPTIRNDSEALMIVNAIYTYKHQGE